MWRRVRTRSGFAASLREVVEVLAVSLCCKQGCKEQARFRVNEQWPVCREHLREVTAIVRAVAREDGSRVMRIEVRVA